jgi:hypothetical protein
MRPTASVRSFGSTMRRTSANSAGPNAAPQSTSSITARSSKGRDATPASTLTATVPTTGARGIRQQHQGAVRHPAAELVRSSTSSG